MGYVPISYYDLPLPTEQEYNSNPDFYIKKLKNYKTPLYLQLFMKSMLIKKEK